MFSLVPQVQAAVDMTSFGNVVNPIITNIVDPVIELMAAVGILMFVWGVAQMIIYANDPDARGRGQQHMLYGTIGMVIMLCAWAVVYIISNTVKGF
jgi:membrane-bound metal-dependent hydrolase YbcI (DUF457 family)